MLFIDADELVETEKFSQFWLPACPLWIKSSYFRKRCTSDIWPQLDCEMWPTIPVSLEVICFPLRLSILG